MKHVITFIFFLITIPCLTCIENASPLSIYKYLMEEFSNNLMETGNFTYEKYSIEVYFCRFFRPITKNAFPTTTATSVTVKNITISFCCHMKITFLNSENPIILKDVFSEFRVPLMTLEQKSNDTKYYLKELEISDLFISKKSEIMNIKMIEEFQQDTNNQYFKFANALTSENVDVILKNKDG
jgi:hypothetical protein